MNPIPDNCQELMDKAQAKFGDHWHWALVSTMTEGIVRIQLMDDGEVESGWRHCVEAPTFEQAIEEAIEFTNSVTCEQYAADYFRRFQ